MKRMISIMVFIAVMSLPALAYARKSTYIITNKRLNYVKLVEVKPAVADEHNMTLSQQRAGAVSAFLASQ